MKIGRLSLIDPAAKPAKLKALDEEGRQGDREDFPRALAVRLRRRGQRAQGDPRGSAAAL
ncbi:MAG: hypothetical protein WDO13_16025 [Verrucomicrobiota bacterium]